MKRIITITCAALYAVCGYSQNTFPANGNVGIGTTTPTEKLDISGNAVVRSTLFTAGPIHGFTPYYGASFYIDNNGSTSYFNATGGNVGIGTTTPVRRFVVSNSGAEGLEFGPGNTPGRSLIGSYNRSGAAVNGLDFHANAYSFMGGSVTFDSPLAGTSATFSDGVTAQTKNFTSNVDGGGFYHSMVNAGMYGDNGYLRITDWDSQMKGINIQVSTGKVGIGTNTPQATLDVNGPAIITGTGNTLTLRKANNVPALAFQGAVGTTTILEGSDDYLTAWVGGGKRLTVLSGGNVGIGTASPDEKLTVKGKIHAEEMRVDLNIPAPDYVFEKTYDLKLLSETEKYIVQNKHLPEMPSAKTMESDGVNVGEMQMKLLKKIEELTLYLIQQSKDNKQQANQIAILQEEVKQLKSIK